MSLVETAQLTHMNEILASNIPSEDLRLRPNLLVEANLANIPWVNFDRTKKAEKGDGSIFRYKQKIDDTLMSCTVAVTIPKKEMDGKLISDTLPTQFDHDVFFCITDLWDEQGRNSNGEVIFRVVDICKRLQISLDSGKNYKLIRTAIDRLSRVVITSKNAFYNAENNIRVDTVVDLMKSEMLSSSDRKIDRVKAILSNQILKNLKRNYSTQINRRIYQDLENGFSKRIFNIVSTQSQQKTAPPRYYDFELFNLAELLPMKGVKHVSKIKDRLSRTINEFKEKNIYECHYIKQSKNSEILRLIPLEKPLDLLDIYAVPTFLGLMFEVYGESLEETLSVSKEAIAQHVNKEHRTLTLEGGTL